MQAWIVNISEEKMVAEQDRTVASLTTLQRFGYLVFSLAVVGIGIEMLICSYLASHSAGAGHKVVPVVPWLPAIPVLVYPVALLVVLCGTGLLVQRAILLSSITFGALMLICALVFDLPRHPDLANAGWRTNVLEPIVFGCLAWLLPNASGRQRLLQILSRYLIAFALVIFGIAHFQVPAYIASLVPIWIPWHWFWTFFFGLGFIAAGIAFATGFRQQWAALATGLMFALWLATIHLPALMATQDADKWSDVLIVAALGGGFWMVAPSLRERTCPFTPASRFFDRQIMGG